MAKSAWLTPAPRGMVEAIRDGRYAVDVTPPDGAKKWAFIKMWRPKSGPRKGQTIISTQHGERFTFALVIDQSGNAHFFNRNDWFNQALLMVCADPFTSAMNYGRELELCSRCGKKLTDTRSRYYSIGPECEKYWPEIINYIDENEGVYNPW